MKSPIRLVGLLATLTLVASACGPSGSAPTTGATQPAATQGEASTGPAALSGSLTIWEAYGASGTSEKDAFDKIVGQIKAANSGLTVNVLDVPFNDLFNKFETSASTGEPDMYIAPNDSLPSEARNGLLADVSDLEAPENRFERRYQSAPFAARRDRAIDLLGRFHDMHAGERQRERLAEAFPRQGRTQEPAAGNRRHE